MQEDLDYAAVEGVRLRQKSESLRDRLAASEAQRTRANECRAAADEQCVAAEGRCSALEGDLAALHARLTPLRVRYHLISCLAHQISWSTAFLSLEIVCFCEMWTAVLVHCHCLGESQQVWTS